MKYFFFIIWFFSNTVLIFADATFKIEKTLNSSEKVVIDHKKLLNVINSVLNYWKNGKEFDPIALHGGQFLSSDKNGDRLTKTLLFIRKVLEDDISRSENTLSSCDFIEKNFELYRWLPDAEGVNKLSSTKKLLKELPNDQILITKYFVKTAVGSLTKTENCPIALYGLPYDELKLSQEQGDQLKGTRFKFGKQEILNGVLDKPKPLAPTLVHLSRLDLEDALLQGTIIAKVNEVEKFYNVYRNNGIAYDRLKSPEEQDRFWYFKEVNGILGYGKDSDHKITITTEVCVAGDVPYFGLGRVFLLKRKENNQIIFRIVVLVDTGGAFVNNRFQLDWLSGQFTGKIEFQAFNKSISDYAEVYILLKKDD